MLLSQMGTWEVLTFHLFGCLPDPHSNSMQAAPTVLEQTFGIQLLHQERGALLLHSSYCTESQNGLAGKQPQRSSSPSPLPWAPSSLALNNSRNEESTTSMSNLFQRLTTLTVTHFFLISNLNLCSVPFPLVLSLNALKFSLHLSCRLPSGTGRLHICTKMSRLTTEVKVQN